MAMERTRYPIAADRGREMVPLRTMMDRLFESAFTPSFWNEFRTAGFGAGGFGVDVYEDDNAFHVRCMLPGIDPNAVNVNVQGNVLTISGETRQTTPEGWRPVFQEIGAGQFQRQVTLATPVDAGKADANYQNGILEITLPKAEEHRPRSIQIKSAGAAR
ncbi:MAG: Hsp20/alpha crystallin family protein [Chloroflexota bacterium]